MQEFEVIIDGEKKTAQIVARLELEKTGIEYIYYYIDDEIDQNGDNYLFTGRVETTEDEEEIIEIQDEEEKKIAFDLFSSVYNDIQN